MVACSKKTGVRVGRTDGVQKNMLAEPGQSTAVEETVGRRDKAEREGNQPRQHGAVPGRHRRRERDEAEWGGDQLLISSLRLTLRLHQIRFVCFLSFFLLDVRFIALIL